MVRYEIIITPYIKLWLSAMISPTSIGVSIAFSIAEQLLASPAYTLFVTHYPQLTSLSTMYTNVKNIHMRTSIDVTVALPTPFHTSNNGDKQSIAISNKQVVLQQQPLQQIKFLYQVTGGPCNMKSGYANTLKLQIPSNLWLKTSMYLFFQIRDNDGGNDRISN